MEFYTVNIEDLTKENPDTRIGADAIQVPSREGCWPGNYEIEQIGIGIAAEHRVKYQGGWYYHKGTENGMDLLERVPLEVLQAEQAAANAQKTKQLQEKGHDCHDFVAHDLYARDNGSMNDYYYCTKCEDVLQVG
jgi:hypothetical protein